MNVRNEEATAELKALINAPFFSVRPHHIIDLVQRGADVNVKNENGDSLLHLLSCDTNNHYDRYNNLITELVQTHKANINIQNANGFTPLQLLIRGTSFTTENAMNLVRLGADPNTKNAKDDSLLHILSHDKNNLHEQNNKAIAELVQSHKANINIQNANGFTPLQRLIRCTSFSTENAMNLVRLGADPNVKNDVNNSLLHILSAPKNNKNNTNNAAIAELVQTHKANINIQNASGLTPLQCLIQRPFQIENAMALIHLGATFDLNQMTENYKNRELSDEEIIKVLKNLQSHQVIDEFYLVDTDNKNDANTQKPDILSPILERCPAQQGDNALYTQKQLAKNYFGDQGENLLKIFKASNLTADELLASLDELKKRAGDSSVERDDKSLKDFEFLRAMFDKKGNFKNAYSSDSETYRLVLRTFEKAILELDPTKTIKFNKQHAQRTVKAVGNSLLGIFSTQTATKDSSLDLEKTVNVAEKNKEKEDTFTNPASDKQRTNRKNRVTLNFLSQESDSDDERIDENDKSSTKKSSKNFRMGNFGEL